MDFLCFNKNRCNYVFNLMILLMPYDWIAGSLNPSSVYTINKLDCSAANISWSPITD